MQNFHVIILKYLGPTTYRGGRISIKSERFNQRVIIDIKPGELPSKTATRWLNNQGFDIVGLGEGGDVDYVISSTFKPLK